MATGGSIGEQSQDNPVAVNITAMADVIFCLIIFFMCSFHFKQLEGKVDSWLPDDKGNRPGVPREVILEEIRVFLRWHPATQNVVRNVGNGEPMNSDEDLMRAIHVRTADYRRAGKTEFPIIIDAMEDVPWQDVVHVLDLCKREKLPRIEFTEPMEDRSRSPRH